MFYQGNGDNYQSDNDTSIKLMKELLDQGVNMIGYTQLTCPILRRQYLTEFRNNVKILLKNPQALEHLKGQPATARLENALNCLKALAYSPETWPKILGWALENR